MNLFGKFLIWMIVLAAMGAAGLTARSIDIRNSWTKKLTDLEKQADSNQKQLDQKTLQLTQLKQDLQLALVRWDSYWQNVETRVNEDGTIEAAIGANAFANLAPSDKPRIVFGFQPTADGQFKYVRPFQVTAQQDDRSALAPIGTLRANEVASWQAGQWRFRESIPAASVDRFTELFSKLTELDERIATKTKDLAQAEQQIQVATEQLSQRLGELLGDPNAAAGPDSPPEFSMGLIKAFEDAVAARDADLAEVDRLRHELKRADEELHGLLEDNRRLMGLLPKASSDVARSAKPATTNDAPAETPARN